MRLVDQLEWITDNLSVVKIDGRWQIVNKTFYAHPKFALRLGTTWASGQCSIELMWRDCTGYFQGNAGVVSRTATVRYP